MYSLSDFEAYERGPMARSTAGGYVPGFSPSLSTTAQPAASQTPTAAYSTSLTPEQTAEQTAALADFDINLFNKPTYTPEQQAYMNSVMEYAAKQEAPFGSFRSAIIEPQPTYMNFGPFSDTTTPLLYSQDTSYLNDYMGQPVENNVQYHFNVPVDSGSKSGNVSVGYNTPVYLINPKTGELYAGGVGFDAAKQVANRARELSVGQGRKANWEIYTGPAGATDFSQFTRSAVDDPNKGVLGTLGDIAKFALPIGLQFVPFLGTALGAGLGLSGLGATAVGTGLTAALGRTAGGVVAGDSVLDSLKAGLTTGALSGLTAGALQGAGINVGGLSSAAKNGITQNLSGAAANAATNAGVASGLDAAGNIVVSGLTNGLGSALTGGLGSIGGALAGNALLNGTQIPATQQPVPETTGSGLEVIANKNLLQPTVGQVTGAAAGSLSNIGQLTPEAPYEGLEVIANKPVASLDNAGSVMGTGLGEIVVNANKAPDIDRTGNVLGGGLGSLITPDPVALDPLAPKPEVDSETKVLSTLDKIRLGLLGGGLLGDLLGGGGQQTPGGTIPAGLNGGLNSTFTSQLPTANLPPATPRTTSDMGDVDYYRYGYGPAQSFFSNVPKGAPNTSQAYTGYAKGGEARLPLSVKPKVEGNINLHNRPSVRNEDGSVSTVRSASFGFDEGEVLLPTVSDDGRLLTDDEAIAQYRQTGRHLGVFATPDEATAYANKLHEDQEREYTEPRSSFAVGGRGDGRSDEIPAMLSDGEYVIDAETVALLGNGSNKAGAQALDKFRVNVRKHKGRPLAKGKFSVDARRPEQYLKGRK